MKILLAHNRYLQAGGEDVAFDAEKKLLQQEGHEVREFVRDNKEIEKMGRLLAARNAIWSSESYRALRKLLSEFKPQVAHFHNTFMLVSPAAYYACRDAGVPVIQSLHNYRLVCPAATFLRNGQTCEICLGKSLPWPGVLHGCWRNSRAQTSVVAAMLTIHRLMGTWQNVVNRYIVLTNFARQKFMEAGFPPGKMSVKPNFVTNWPSAKNDRIYAMFVGRLSSEKGIETLLKAWQLLHDKIPLKIAGDGPAMEKLRAFVENRKIQGSIHILGWQSQNDVRELMRSACFLVFPSEWYEGFPLTIAEAFACGTPVIASNLGAMAEIVSDGQTGLLFDAGNTESLANKVSWAWAHPKEMETMGQNARREYEEKYTAEKNYAALMEIYTGVIAERSG